MAMSPAVNSIRKARERKKEEEPEGHVGPATSEEIEKARALYGQEGEIEIDDSAKASRAEGNPDGGVYISAWVWVPDENWLGGYPSKGERGCKKWGR